MTSLESAYEEMKRVEHLLFVSLKYTRTVDVIRNLLKRIISAFEYGMTALLEYKGIEETPKIPKVKYDLIKKNYDNKLIHAHMEFYLFLRKLMRCEYDKKEEFRRHVTMISHYQDQIIEVNIDNLENLYTNVTKKFLNLVKNIVLEIKEE